MISAKYSTKAEELVKAIDIAIEAIQKYPPKDYNKNHVDHFLNVYKDWKSKVVFPLPQYKNMQSLKSLINDFLTYYQESGGEDVEYFWTKIKQQNLDFKRENKLAKILKRGKIKTRIEYDFLTDVIVPYHQEGLITDEEDKELRKMIGDFEFRITMK